MMSGKIAPGIPGLPTYIISTVELTHPGGISNYYSVLSDNRNLISFNMEFRYVSGNRKATKNLVKKATSWVAEMISFNRNLRAEMSQYQYSGIIVNPSLNLVPLFRDLIILYFIPDSSIKKIVFLRGWRESYYTLAKKRTIQRLILLALLKKSDLVIVQARVFARNLLLLGVEKEFHVLRTLSSKCRKNVPIGVGVNSFLYLGKLRKDKGLYDLLAALHAIDKSLIRGCVFRICGLDDSGEIPSEFTDKVKYLGLESIVEICGEVKGEDKEAVLLNSHVLIFPSYDEGCPNSVIEAMAYGLYIMSTEVGAVPELVHATQPGRFLKKSDPHSIVEEIEWCLKNQKLVFQSATDNHAEYMSSLNVTSHIRKLNDIVIGEVS